VADADDVLLVVAAAESPGVEDGAGAEQTGFHFSPQ
jgi:hypothetical protein